MKSSCPKEIRSARIAAAVSAMLLLGTTLSGCHDSQNRSNDEVKLTVAEEGDLATGKPYKIRADRNLQELRADHGEITTVNPVTGENAGEKEWFYVFSEENFTSYEPNFAGNSGAPDNDVNDGADSDGEKSNLKAFTETFHATLENGKTPEAKQTFAVTDPLLPDQWHLWNSGQNPYGVTDPPLKKIDLNVIPAWRLILPEEKKQLSGSGVYVAVYDIQADINHEDLKENIYYPEIAGDGINTGLPLEILKEYSEEASHGTSVAGIIAASAMNRLGGRGIAFDARLTSFSESSETVTLPLILKTERMNLVNASWGAELRTFNSEAAADLYEALYDNNIAVVHAIGNGFDEGSSEKNPYSSSQCELADANCEFTQTNNLARYPFNINVGALNSLGEKASYSCAGANIWVTGFGGEFGADVTDPPVIRSSAAMVTVLTSYDPKDFGDPDANSPWRNQDNIYYTNTMNGTSSAAPTVSGVLALVYQAKPDITVSQIRYLLAATSRNDSVMPTLALTPKEEQDDVYGESFPLSQGWQDNAAGFRFSDYYGFGVIDAHALALGALSCDSDPVCAGLKSPPEKQVSANENPCAYTDASKRNVTCTFSDFRAADEGNDSLGKAVLTVDALTFDVSGLNYLPSGLTDSCEKAVRAEEGSEEKKKAVFDVNHLLEIRAASQSGTELLVKNIYSNWDYGSGYEPDEDDPDAAAMEPLELAVSGFYREPLSESAEPDKRYQISFKSVCELDLESLNEKMHLTVYGRRESR
ncbi:S8 family serine peptidase [Succinimonas sp.]|uniref:S8 family serine peptidase n=1 Tax=Succinimonas sp. TaxID=1936151 RepID=UPI00386C0453